MATGFDRGKRQYREKVNDVSQVRKVLKTLPQSIIGCLLRKLKVTLDNGLTSVLAHGCTLRALFWDLVL